MLLQYACLRNRFTLYKGLKDTTQSHVSQPVQGCQLLLGGLGQDNMGYTLSHTQRERDLDRAS